MSPFNCSSFFNRDEYALFLVVIGGNFASPSPHNWPNMGEVSKLHVVVGAFISHAHITGNNMPLINYPFHSVHPSHCFAY